MYVYFLISSAKLMTQEGGVFCAKLVFVCLRTLVSSRAEDGCLCYSQMITL